MIQNKDGVMIRCADGTTYHGDILVGADGAHSGVRQALFSSLRKHNLLPVSDSTELSKGFLAMVGTTDPMDPEKYPFLKNKKASSFNQVIGRGTSYNVSFIFCSTYSTSFEECDELTFTFYLVFF